MTLKSSNMPNIGEFDKRGTFQFPVRQADGMGGNLASNEGTDYQTVWARWNQFSGSEARKAGRPGNTIIGELTVHYDSNIQSDMLWKFSHYMIPFLYGG